ncbi:nucleotidyltransferase domain-containing protein [Hyphomicrobiaceae bacterium 22]|uniref:Nucleotidyltransferase domain-containing protein n=2 Tax=Prosthecodimorpha staleyi TaxID=2840188 RepID=A0A947D4G6_9HYPH|nr:nucleotidyltransferase domain-containing protein [Prosthecodimorpha staleyi]
MLGGRVASEKGHPELTAPLGHIRATYRPVAILLYGSRARGDATTVSDWDLKVIVPDDAPDHVFSTLLAWKTQEGSGVYADISCARLSDFVAGLNVPNTAANLMADEAVLLEISRADPSAPR